MLFRDRSLGRKARQWFLKTQPNYLGGRERVGIMGDYTVLQIFCILTLVMAFSFFFCF